jgi:hypothetical protein
MHTIEPTDTQNPDDGAPEIESIPTLSEWKQIFLTLIMLSLVMGFMRKTHPKAALSYGGTMLRITDSNFLAFNRHVYTSALKRVGVVVVLGLAGVTVASGHFYRIVGYRITFDPPTRINQSRKRRFSSKTPQNFR